MWRRQDKQLEETFKFIINILWFIVKSIYIFIIFLLTSFCEYFWSRQNRDWVHMCRWIVLLIVLILGLVWYIYRAEIIRWTTKTIICIRVPMKCIKREARKDFIENYNTWTTIN